LCGRIARLRCGDGLWFLRGDVSKSKVGGGKKRCASGVKIGRRNNEPIGIARR
jgi:hypothetical protein